MLVCQTNADGRRPRVAACAENEMILGGLATALSAEGAEYPVRMLSDCGAGIAYEVTPRRRSFDREACKLSYVEKENVACCSLSRIKRTMADAALLSSMGLSQDGTDPNSPPPTDAQLICGHLGKMLAKQRWSKASNALSALRAMKLGADPARAAQLKEGEGAGEPAEPAAMPVPSRGALKRLSITSLTQTSEPSAEVAAMKMGKLPSAMDVIEVLGNINGQFVFCILELSKEYVLVARTDSPQTLLYWCNIPGKGLFFGTEKSAFPSAGEPVEFPVNSFLIGRSEENPQPVPFK